MTYSQGGSQPRGPGGQYVPPRFTGPVCGPPGPGGRVGITFSTPAPNGSGPSHRTGTNAVPLSRARTWPNANQSNQPPPPLNPYLSRPQSGGPVQRPPSRDPPPRPLNTYRPPQLPQPPPHPPRQFAQTHDIPRVIQPAPSAPVAPVTDPDWGGWGEEPSQPPLSPPSPPQLDPPPHQPPPPRPVVISQPPPPPPATNQPSDDWDDWGASDQPSQPQPSQDRLASPSPVPADLATATSSQLKRAALANACPAQLQTSFPQARPPSPDQPYTERTAAVDEQQRAKLANIDAREDELRARRLAEQQRDAQERRARDAQRVVSPAVATKEKLYANFNLGSTTAQVTLESVLRPEGGVGKAVLASKGRREREREETVTVAPVRRKAAVVAAKAISPKRKKKTKRRNTSTFTIDSDSEITSPSETSESDFRPHKQTTSSKNTPPKKLRTPQKKRQAAASQPSDSEPEPDKSPLVVKLKLPPMTPERDKSGPPPGDLGSSPSSELMDLSAAIELQRAKVEQEKAKARKAKQKAQFGDEMVLLSDESSANCAGDSDSTTRRRAGKQRRPSASSPTPEADTAPVSTNLCPFCSSTMPVAPSERLRNLETYLLKSPNVRPHPTARNPRGKRLPFSERSSFCAMHENEAEHIPRGIRQGWPTSPNWDELEKRMQRDMPEYVWDVIMGKKGGGFFELAKSEWKQKGVGRMRASMNEMGSIGIEQPGYYGPKGAEIMRKAIYKYFVDQGMLTELHTTPLSLDHYVRRVLIPECAVELIRRDLAVKRGQDPDQATDAARLEAEEVCEHSRRFGTALHSTSDEMDQFAEEEEEEERVRAEEAKEERRREKEKEGAARKGGRGKDQGKAAAAVPSSGGQASSSSAPGQEVGRRVPLRRPKRAAEVDIGRGAGGEVAVVDITGDADEAEEVRPVKKARRVKAPAQGATIPVQ